MSDVGPQTPPEGPRLAARYLEPGTIVHLYGIPVRLVLGVNVETTEGNLKIIDEREVGVKLAKQLADVPPLSAQPPYHVPPPPAYVPPAEPAPMPKEDFLKAVKQWEEEKRQGAKVPPPPAYVAPLRQLPQRPWYDGLNDRWVHPTITVPQVQIGPVTQFPPQVWGTIASTSDARQR